MYSPDQDAPALPITPYLDGSGVALEAPRLEGTDHEQFDIVVVGGGLTGLSLALHAAEEGARVALLESRQIGWGASGRNGGHVPPATKLEPSEIIRRYGPERGMRLLDAVSKAPDLVFDLAQKHGIEAESVRSGIITAATTPSSLETLKRRAEFWAAHGTELRTLSPVETATTIGTDRYFGSSLDPRGGTINPMALVRGMAQAAARLGVIIFEESAVTACEREGTGWRVSTGQGGVKADRVVLCTNAYTGKLFKSLRTSIVPVRAYQFLTEPLPESQRDFILPGRQGVTDTRRLMSGYRMLTDGSLLFSGIGKLFGGRIEPDLDYSLGRIRRLFPQIADFRLAYSWTGWMAMNRENAWKIHELAPGLMSVIGCNGRGLAIGVMLGRDIAEYFRGKPPSELLLPISPVEPIPFFNLHPILVPALVTYYRLRDTVDDKAL